MLVRIVSLLAIHKPLEIINFVSSDGLFNWILMLPFYFIYLFIIIIIIIIINNIIIIIIIIIIFILCQQSSIPSIQPTIS